jgi:hypothetical protein
MIVPAPGVEYRQDSYLEEWSSEIAGRDVDITSPSISSILRDVNQY